MTFLTTKTFFMIHFLSIHHGEIGDGLIADRTVVHAVGTYRISFTVQVYIHINVEEVFTCNTTETCRMPAFVIEKDDLSLVDGL
jgi:hypothetical protein